MFDILRKIRIWFMGKKPAVLGLRGSGKTTLLKFIQTGVLQHNYNPTNSEEIARSNNNSYLELTKNVKDFGGSSDFHDRWKAQISEADIIIYIIDCEKCFISENTTFIKKQITNDLQVIKSSLDNKKGAFTTILYLNKIDFILKSKEHINTERHNIKAQISEHSFINICFQFLKTEKIQPQIVIGSLDNTENALLAIKEIAGQ